MDISIFLFQKKEKEEVGRIDCRHASGNVTW